MRHSEVSDHGRHLLVLIRTHGTLVGRVARWREELSEVGLVVSLCQVAVEVAGLLGLHCVAVNTEDTIWTLAARSWWLDVLISCGHIL